MPDVVLDRYPGINVDHDTKELYRGYLRHELLAGHCEDCGRWHTPPRPRCPECWSTSVGSHPVSGRGTIHTLTLLHQGPPGVPYAPPWPVAGIELAEQPGLRVVGTLVDTPVERQRIGEPMELTWIERDGAPWPAFRPC